MKPIREWQGGDIEPAMFAVAFLVVALILTIIMVYVFPPDEYPTGIPRVLYQQN